MSRKIGILADIIGYGLWAAATAMLPYVILLLLDSPASGGLGDERPRFTGREMQSLMLYASYPFLAGLAGWSIALSQRPFYSKWSLELFASIATLAAFVALTTLCLISFLIGFGPGSESGIPSLVLIGAIITIASTLFVPVGWGATVIYVRFVRRAAARCIALPQMFNSAMP